MKIPVECKKAFAALGKHHFSRFGEKRSHHIYPAHDVVAAQESFCAMSYHLRHFTVIMVEEVQSKCNVRAVQPLLAGKIEAISVYGIKQGRQCRSQFL